MEIHKEFRQRRRRGKILESRFYILHPVVLFLYFIGVFTFPFLFASPVFSGSIFIATGFVAMYYNGIGKTLKYILNCLPIGLFVLLITPLTSHRGNTILFYLLENPVTLEAIVYGALSFILILNMLLTFTCFNKLINSERFLFLFSKAAAKTAFITSMSLRFVSLFKSRGMAIADVQKTRGIDLKSGSLKNRIKSAGILFEALICWSLEEGMATSETLKAKAYGTGRRTNYTIYRFVGVDYACIAVLGVVLLALVWLRITGVGAYNPYTQVFVPGFDTPAACGYALMMVFVLAPFITDFFILLRKRCGLFAKQ